MGKKKGKKKHDKGWKAKSKRNKARSGRQSAPSGKQRRSRGPVVLRVRNLRTTFHTVDRTVHAVQGVDFDLHRGEILGIVGESGSGKSVTSLSVMGLVRPPGVIEADTIELNSENLLGLSDRQMRGIRGKKVAMIFQSPMTSLNPFLTVGDQIAESAELHLGMSPAEARERAIELLIAVGIPGARERVDVYPHEFSGGMRQRVMIAIALACDPDVLIADEPTTALDVTIQAQILELLQKLRDERGMAIILITHDLGVVAGTCDRVIVMYAGRVVEENATLPLFEEPAMPYTYGLMRSIPRLDAEDQGELYSIEGMPPDLSKPIAGCPFAPRCEFREPRCEDARPELLGNSAGGKSACFLDWQAEPEDSESKGAAK